MPTKYELERLERIKANRALLAGLGIDELKPPKSKRVALVAPPAKTKTKTGVVRKRKAEVKAEDDYTDVSGDDDEDDEEGDEDERKPKRKKRKAAPSAPAGVRRSSRNAGRTIDYKAERRDGQPQPVVPIVGYLECEDEDEDGEERVDRTALGKSYGAIPGVAVGTWWKMRAECRLDGIHLPLVAGISGCANGAYSVALSGGYEDDVDLGDGFVFTGSGGRDLKGTPDHRKNLRTAPQSSDQSFENHYNRALKKSVETRKPVRVIRGFKLKSPYAPVEGYRYDGLYTVEKAWMEKGLNAKGYLVCKFAFKRLPGQPPLPYRDIDEEAVGSVEPKDETETVKEEDVEDEPASDDA